MSDVVFLTGGEQEYNRIKRGEENMLFTTFDSRLPVNVNDCIPVVFKSLDNSMLIEIVDFGYKFFGDLTVDDARSCGFGSVDDLKKSLVHKYPLLDSASRVYFYVFEVIGVNEKVGE